MLSAVWVRLNRPHIDFLEHRNFVRVYRLGSNSSNGKEEYLSLYRNLDNNGRDFLAWIGLVTFMKFANLSPTVLEKIKAARWDRIIEKHEGPERWESVLKYYDVEFIEFEGRWILLPVDRSSHPNITILRSVWSESGHSVTLFLKDTTYYDDPFFSGFITVCDRVKDEGFFLAIVYHEWFIIEPAEGVFES